VPLDTVNFINYIIIFILVKSMQKFPSADDLETISVEQASSTA